MYKYGLTNYQWLKLDPDLWPYIIFIFEMLNKFGLDLHIYVINSITV